jgi:glutamate dehydrogenase
MSPVTAIPDKDQLLHAAREALAAGSQAAHLTPLLFARPPAEDLAALGPARLAAMAEAAGALLARHRAGEALVEIRRLAPDAGMGAEAGSLVGPLAVLTIVQDDMPFLFDSVAAEVADRSAAVHAVSHPILQVRRGADGALQSFGPAPAEAGAQDGERVSLIQIAFEPLLRTDADAVLTESLRQILGEVSAATGDFHAMRERVREASAALRARAAGADPAQAAAEREGAALLDWLCDDNFIFLGLREFRYFPDGEALRRMEGSELGILRDPTVRVLRREGGESATSPEIRAFLEEPAPLIVAKANARSRVHRRVYMDYVGIKLRDAAGGLVGELRVVGLFSSAAYTRPVLSIPYLRQKAETVIARFGFAPRSHSGKALAVALDT